MKSSVATPVAQVQPKAGRPSIALPFVLAFVATPPGIMSLAMSAAGVGGSSILAALFGLFLLDAVVSKTLMRVSTLPILAMSGIAIAYAVGGHDSMYPGTKPAITLFLTLPVLFCLCQQSVLRGDRVRAAERMVDAVSASLTVTAAIGLAQFFLGLGDLGVPGPGMAGHKNAFGYLCSLGFALAFVMSGEGSSRGRIYRLLVPIFGLSVIISMSRGAWAASLLALIAVSTTNRKATYGLAALLVAAALLAIGSVVPGVRSRFEGDDVSSGRLGLWEVILPNSLEEIVGGRGVGYMWSLNQYDINVYGGYVSEANSSIYAHNDFIFLLVELGILGSLAWLTCVLTTLWISSRVARRADPDRRRAALGLACLVTCLVLMVGQMVDTIFFASYIMSKILPLMAIAWTLPLVGGKSAGADVA